MALVSTRAIAGGIVGAYEGHAGIHGSPSSFYRFTFFFNFSREKSSQITKDANKIIM